MGGFDGKNALDANQSYTPELDQPGEIPWVEQQRLPKTRYSMGITSIADMIYLVGGKGDTTPIEYQSQENDWKALDANPAQVNSDLTLVTFDTYIYSIGEILAGNKVDELQAYKAIYTISIPILR